MHWYERNVLLGENAVIDPSGAISALKVNDSTQNWSLVFDTPVMEINPVKRAASCDVTSIQATQA